ncbi:MAG: cyclodeaminase/cyclohydrolase family protein [Coriobacteriaceae bacterium]
MGACEVPLEIMACACRSSSPACSWPGTARCWLGCRAGAVLAKAALMAASLNVVINIGSMDDVERADAHCNRWMVFPPQGRHGR